jgi:hypothetical protein
MNIQIFQIKTSIYVVQKKRSKKLNRFYLTMVQIKNDLKYKPFKNDIATKDTKNTKVKKYKTQGVREKFFIFYLRIPRGLIFSFTLFSWCPLCPRQLRPALPYLLTSLYSFVAKYFYFSSSSPIQPSSASMIFLA